MRPQHGGFERAEKSFVLIRPIPYLQQVGCGNQLELATVNIYEKNIQNNRGNNERYVSKEMK